MKLFNLRSVTLAFALVFLSNPTVIKAGLYGDDAKNATSGDLNDQDYWWSKFDALMLDIPVKQHQP